MQVIVLWLVQIVRWFLYFILALKIRCDTIWQELYVTNLKNFQIFHSTCKEIFSENLILPEKILLSKNSYYQQHLFSLNLRNNSYSFYFNWCLFIWALLGNLFIKSTSFFLVYFSHVMQSFPEPWPLTNTYKEFPRPFQLAI